MADTTDLQPTQPQPKIPWNPFVALIIVVALYFVAPIIGGLLVSVYPALRGWSTTMATDWLNSSVYAQFFYVVFAEALTIAGLLAFLRMNKRKLADIGFKRPRFKDVGIGMLAYPVYFIVFAIAILVVAKFVPAINVNQEQELGFNDIHGTLPLIVTFISLVVLPPLVEEITVRGFLFTSLRKHCRLWVSIVLTSFIFAAAHLPEGGSGGPLYVAAIDTFLLSLVLCYVREKTGSLWAGITLHAIKNGVAYISLFILAVR